MKKINRIVIILLVLFAIAIVPQSCSEKSPTGSNNSSATYQSETGDCNRVGAICNDGWESTATGQGACSHHGGVKVWLCSD